MFLPTQPVKTGARFTLSVFTGREHRRHFGHPTATVWNRFCGAESERLGYCDVDTQSVVEQFQLADETLFERLLNNDRHVFHSLLPPGTEYSYNLRRRRHDYELIAKTRKPTLTIYYLPHSYSI